MESRVSVQLRVRLCSWRRGGWYVAGGTRCVSRVVLVGCCHYADCCAYAGCCDYASCDWEGRLLALGPVPGRVQFKTGRPSAEEASLDSTGNPRLETLRLGGCTRRYARSEYHQQRRMPAGPEVTFIHWDNNQTRDITRLGTQHILTASSVSSPGLAANRRPVGIPAATGRLSASVCPRQCARASSMPALVVCLRQSCFSVCVWQPRREQCD